VLGSRLERIVAGQGRLHVGIDQQHAIAEVR
jgi:hypothetical protein